MLNSPVSSNKAIVLSTERTSNPCWTALRSYILGTNYCEVWLISHTSLHELLTGTIEYIIRDVFGGASARSTNVPGNYYNTVAWVHSQWTSSVYTLRLMILMPRYYNRNSDGAVGCAIEQSIRPSIGHSGFGLLMVRTTIQEVFLNSKYWVSQ